MFGSGKRNPRFQNMENRSRKIACKVCFCDNYEFESNCNDCEENLHNGKPLLPANFDVFLPYVDENTKQFQNLRDSPALIGNIDIPSPHRQLYQFSFQSLISGRPLGSAMIVMFGQTGSGKSATVNSLFSDESLCPSKSGQSVTREVTEYRKKLDIDDKTFPLKGYISIIDVPGSLDTDKSKELINLAAILQFREIHECITRRKITDKYLAKGEYFNGVREYAYPNLILFTFETNDARLDGNDSNFTNCLNMLRLCNLVDEQCPNVIFVGTKVASLPTVPVYFQKKIDAVKTIVSEKAMAILRITDPKIVFVENCPDEYGWKKENGGDYYKMPNDDLMPRNLFLAISDQLQTNQDKLGLFITSHYFDSTLHVPTSAVEKRKVKEFTIPNKVFPKFEDYQHKAELLLTDKFVKPDHTSHKRVVLQNLGYGFCPLSGNLKNNICEPTLMKLHKLENGSEVCLPEFAEVMSMNETFSTILPFLSDEEYQFFVKDRYGLNSDLELGVYLDSNSDQTLKTRKYSYLFEKRIARIWVDSFPEKQLNSKFKKETQALPEEIDDVHQEQFDRYFDKWGSFVVREVWLGGSIRVDITVDVSSFDIEKERKFLSEITSLFNEAFSGGGTERLFAEGAEESKYLLKNNLLISGGGPNTMTNLKDVTPQNLNKWLRSVDEEPIELKHSLILYAFYKLDIENSSSVLRQKTFKYLKNEASLRVKRQPTRKEDAKRAKSKSKTRNNWCILL